MIGNAEELARERELLVMRSRMQRATLIADAQPLLSGARSADRVTGLVRGNALLLGLGAAAVAFFGRRHLLAALSRGLAIYAFFRK